MDAPQDEAQRKGQQTQKNKAKVNEKKKEHITENQGKTKTKPKNNDPQGAKH